MSALFLCLSHCMCLPCPNHIGAKSTPRDKIKKASSEPNLLFLVALKSTTALLCQTPLSLKHHEGDSSFGVICDYYHLTNGIC